MEWLFYPLLLQFGIFTSSAKLYSENNVYTTNSSTTYSNIPSDCSLFGSKFETDDFEHKIILNVTRNVTYWIGAKIGFKRNINPLGVQKECNGNQSGSLDECNNHCKGWKYFSYNDQSCSCFKSNKADDGLARTYKCENPENGLCFINKCVVYERNVLDKDYVCDVHHFEKSFGSWIFTTEKCSTKLNFICDIDGKLSYSENITRSWLEAEHECSKRGLKLIQTENIDDKFKDGRKYWISIFRRKKISRGIDNTKTVCVAARIQSNGSYQLETHFCNESLEPLCHSPNHTNYGSSDAGIVIICKTLFASKYQSCNFP
ncbi:unnamed protein product [Mytilus coruscus]|uniref:C-type lectin domain-containing protein n=1 Tax=Mytilus coruscus TaxID=42192 RepID=A0A6J8D6K7_MYTCO|nr:unnamed protein product [Mytilus coruscus]